MRALKQISFWVLALFPTLGTGHATMRIVQKEISVSRALAGQVFVQGSNAPANGVMVELCSSDWKTVLASTKTDEMGRFSFTKSSGGLSYIRVSGAGMNIYELRVRIDKHAVADLTIHLSIAT